MKLLAFTPDHARDFSLAHVALLTDEVRLTPAERRSHGKLLDRFETASVEGDQGRVLIPDGTELVIEDAEHALLLKMFEAAAWRPMLSREVNACEDFLKAASEYTHKAVV